MPATLPRVTLPAANNNRAKVPTRGTYAARLYTLASVAQDTKFNDVFEDDGTIKLNFPSMPDEIDFSRTAEYWIQNFQTLPDGFHVYKQTNPLKLPLSFSLHSFDPVYAENGPLTVLMLGAKLHALTLPIIPTLASVVSQAPPTTAAQSQGTSDANIKNRTEAPDTPLGSFKPGDSDTFYGPPPCVLDLIVGLPSAPGVQCQGYVESVSVKLRGPWLTSADGRFRNLPSSAKYDFTFVHSPSYTNKYQNNDFGESVQLRQAGAREVFSSFYNTLPLSVQSNIGVVGLNYFANQAAVPASGS